MVGRGGSSLKTRKGSGRTNDKMVAVGSKQGGRRRGGPRRTNGVVGGGRKGGGGKGRGSRGEGRNGGPGRGQKGGENVVAIVDGGGEGGILNTREEERGWSRWIRWKEIDELECFGVGAAAGNAVVFGDGFVESGGNIEQPPAAKL